MLDKFKDAYLELLKRKAEKELDEDDLYLAEDDSIVESIQEYIRKLNLTIELLENNDKLAIQAALLRISTFLSGICGVFDQTREDIDRFTLIQDTADFPETYKIPEHYNYPIK